MRIIDVSGAIENGMWNYGDPWPEVCIDRVPQADWVPLTVNTWKLSFAGQSGTYLQTGLHFRDDGPALIDIPVESLVNRDAVVLKVPGKENQDDMITVEDLERCEADIRPGDAVLVAIGRDAKWRDPDYISGSPYYAREAMDWIAAREPFLLGGDWPKWESLENPQYVFDPLVEHGILLLAPMVNLMKISKQRVKLTVLPLKAAETAHAPARAIVIEE